MSRAAVARLLIALALLVLIPSACSERWFESPDREFDVDSLQYVAATATAGMADYSLEREGLADVAATVATGGVMVVAVMTLVALLTSFGGHGTNHIARYTVIALIPIVIVATLYSIGETSPPWQVRGLWPPLFITSLIILAAGIALLPQGGRDLVVAEPELEPEPEPA